MDIHLRPPVRSEPTLPVAQAAVRLAHQAITVCKALHPAAPRRSTFTRAAQDGRCAILARPATLAMAVQQPNSPPLASTPQELRLALLAAMRATTVPMRPNTV